MKDLKVEVCKVIQRCGAKHEVGQYFYVRGGGKIELPANQSFCMYALQSITPFLAAKQHENELPEDDWIPRTDQVCCPDPKGIVMKVTAL